ncbi:hypothetical protein TrST_g4052 [Triparma strigata]|uniref:WGR domain-containing protein n=1 Tax=Triparma strigata TaxID=1606541 RepID=A0A9W7EVC7_9STRA|nr:hypothetical protein TrST_g4052 [Triparma strigata]
MASVKDDPPSDVYRVLLPKDVALTAELICYKENNKSCGSKFFVLHSHLSSLRIFSRSGHTKTGRGNMSEIQCDNEEALLRRVEKIVKEREGREGEGKFVNAVMPLSIPEVKVKAKKRKCEEEEVDEPDLEPMDGFTNYLIHSSKNKWYQIRWDGGTSGCLSFGQTEDGQSVKKGSGTIRPKAFTTVRLAKSYFENYLKKKLKDNYEVVVED